MLATEVLVWAFNSGESNRGGYLGLGEALIFVVERFRQTEVH